MHSMTSATFPAHAHVEADNLWCRLVRQWLLCFAKGSDLTISSCRMTTRPEIHGKSFQRNLRIWLLLSLCGSGQSALNQPHHPLSCYDSMLVCLYPCICHFQLFSSPQHPWLHFPTQFKSWHWLTHQHLFLSNSGNMRVYSYTLANATQPQGKPI